MGVIRECPRQDMVGVMVGLVHWSQDRLLTVRAKCGTFPGRTEVVTDLEMSSVRSCLPPLEADRLSVLGEDLWMCRAICEGSRQLSLLTTAFFSLL